MGWKSCESGSLANGETRRQQSPWRITGSGFLALSPPLATALTTSTVTDLDNPARTAGAAATVQDADYPATYKRVVLVMLTIVYAFNFIDRQILVILQEPIKADMALSDAQLGLLSGFTFAVIYVTAGIPIAFWADRSNRRNIVALALAVWSGMTALSGLVQNYGQLLLARVGVGLGEAGGSPPAHSMISDYFPPRQRATALSFYSSGIYVGILLGYAFGGVLAEAFGWRAAFLVVGLPGVLFAVILLLVVREPVRGRWDRGCRRSDRPSGIRFASCAGAGRSGTSLSAAP
jgi:MFS family permease